MNAVQRLSRITLVCSDPERLADFYKAALGFERTGEASITELAFATLIRIPDATARVMKLQLGEQEVELIAIHPPGQSYPHGVSGRSPLFRHLAIVVSDMAAVYERLQAHRGWAPISTDGPQLLPVSSGGVTAYKFRDPDGHPLELIAFAHGNIPVRWQKVSAKGYLGIDHSAISVAHTERSVKFYERLGLRRIGGSLNQGPEQDKLDDVAGAHVEVTALAPTQISTPHVEQLCYRGGFDQGPAVLGTNDIAATRLVLKLENEEILEDVCAEIPEAILSGPVRFKHGAVRAILRDPDGHLLTFEALL
jgi:catechol 2,3-dioxygenase-like lactoylglutathione lyase family enzyme